jgi:hypothetical protein
LNEGKAGPNFPLTFPKDDEEDDDMTANDDATLNQFERLMLKENWPGDSDRARTAVRDVADTMYACREWFEGYKVPYTGADLVAMTKLILARERDLSDKAKREKFDARHRIGEDAP